MPKSILSPLLSPRVIDQFWAKVSIGEPDACWAWNGYCGPLGYGRARINQRTYAAHRVAWTIAYGEIPNGLCVCHDCPAGDNPSCVNPRHLFLGTHDDNMADMVRKNRQRYFIGVDNPSAKLTESDIVIIRELYAQGGMSQRAIGDLYGVGNQLISRIVRRKAWKHV